MKNYRPSAVPLVTVDPFFSLWSMSDKLYDDVTHHWTGPRNPMSAGVWIDGKYYKVMGEIAIDSDRRSRSFEPYIPQVSMEIQATQTRYAFADERVKVELLFTTPLLMDRLDILARPVSYVEYNVEIVDGLDHDVKFHFDISSECCIDKLTSRVVGGRTANSVYVGNEEQKVIRTRQFQDYSKKFHTYVLEWDESVMRILIDDEEVGRVNIADANYPNGDNPLKTPCYIIMNTAIGGQGTWPEQADPKDYPVNFEIDYVRYYTKK